MRRLPTHPGAPYQGRGGTEGKGVSYRCSSSQAITRAVNVGHRLAWHHALVLDMSQSRRIVPTENNAVSIALSIHNLDGLPMVFDLGALCNAVFCCFAGEAPPVQFEEVLHRLENVTYRLEQTVRAVESAAHPPHPTAAPLPATPGQPPGLGEPPDPPPRTPAPPSVPSGQSPPPQHCAPGLHGKLEPTVSLYRSVPTLMPNSTHCKISVENIG